MSVVISQSDLNFAELFRRKKGELCGVVGLTCQIHHVGSTAVPGLDGKNILDVLITALDHGEMLVMRDRLVSAGYVMGRNTHGCNDYIFMSSRNGETGQGDTHLHLAVRATDKHDDFLVLRDYLRAHREEAERYARAKYWCVERAQHDRALYKRYKSEYVDALMVRVRVWRASGD